MATENYVDPFLPGGSSNTSNIGELRIRRRAGLSLPAGALFMNESPMCVKKIVAERSGRFSTFAGKAKKNPGIDDFLLAEKM